MITNSPAHTGESRPHSSEPIVEIEDVALGFGSRTILSGLNFSVARGEVFFVAGNSGSGKSTLFKNIVGLHTPLAGSIRVAGFDAINARGEQRRELLRHIGISYQGGALFGSLTVKENVILPLKEFTILTPRQRDAVAQAKLTLVGLEDAANRYPSQISGGMIKRAAVARALALDPPLVILDEPSAGLDPLSSAELDTLIATLANLLNTTFMIVSHELRSIFAIADRVVLLNADRQTQVAIGPPEHLLHHADDPWVRRFLAAGDDPQDAGDPTPSSERHPQEPNP